MSNEISINDYGISINFANSINTNIIAKIEEVLGITINLELWFKLISPTIKRMGNKTFLIGSIMDVGVLTEQLRQSHLEYAGCNISDDAFEVTEVGIDQQQNYLIISEIDAYHALFSIEFCKVFTSNKVIWVIDICTSKLLCNVLLEAIKEVYPQIPIDKDGDINREQLPNCWIHFNNKEE